jgi:hypothetical protein
MSRWYKHKPECMDASYVPSLPAGRVPADNVLRSHGLPDDMPVFYLDGYYYVPDGMGYVREGTVPPGTIQASDDTAPAGGLKFDGDKPRPTLLMRGCPNALAGVINVLGFGARKYAADSWKQVEGGTVRYRDALYRHLMAVEAGEVLDPESGLPHWHHICCNALFLAELNHKDSK